MSKNSTRVTDLYEDETDFSDLLEAAEKADPVGEAADFVDEIQTKYRKWGAGMFLSHKQKAWLERIAEDAR